MGEDAHHDERRRTPFWIAFGFIAAFAATIVTVVLTGLFVRGPGSARPAAVEPSAEPSTRAGSAAESSVDSGAQRAAEATADDNGAERAVGERAESNESARPAQ